MTGKVLRKRARAGLVYVANTSVVFPAAQCAVGYTPIKLLNLPVGS